MIPRSPCLAIVLALACAAAAGQGYPARPLKVVLPVPPGGLQDTLTRAIAQDLSVLWGVSVLAENRPGAGGVTAADAVARAAPDGYTVLMADGVPLTITPFLNRNLPYDPVKDFVAIVGLAQSSSAVIATSNAPFNSMAELIALAKSKPGDVSYGSFGIGASNHLGTERLALMAGVKFLHVPYKGGPDIMRAIMAGELDFSLAGLTAAIPLIRQGRMKVIAWAGKERPAALPNTPLISDTVPGFANISFFGWWAPAGTARPVVEKIAADASRVLSSPQFREKNITGVGLEPLDIGPDRFAELVRTERGHNEEIVKRLALKLN